MKSSVLWKWIQAANPGADRPGAGIVLPCKSANGSGFTDLFCAKIHSSHFSNCHTQVLQLCLSPLLLHVYTDEHTAVDLCH